MPGVERMRLFITGAGSGIGLETARRAKAAGARVAGTVQGVEQRGILIEELGAAAVFDVDITDAPALDAAMAEADAHFGGLDGAVAAAGIIARLASTETSDADWARVLDTNLTGAFTLARGAARRMRAAGAGSIVMVSSQLGLVGHAKAAAYTVSKAGVNGLVRSMALELATEGVRVNAVAPGPTATPMNADIRADSAYVKETLAAVPMGRFGTPGEIAAVILFLLSDAASFITGEVICADGGYTAR